MRYRVNRTAREVPHEHHCSECGKDERCVVVPCYRPAGAPFSMCDECIKEAVDATMRLIEKMEQATRGPSA